MSLPLTAVSLDWHERQLSIEKVLSTTNVDVLCDHFGQDKTVHMDRLFIVFVAIPFSNIFEICTNPLSNTFADSAFKNHTCSLTK
jgi:hypothetical protein